LRAPLPPIFKCKVCGSYVEEPLHCSRAAELLVDGARRLRASKLLTAILRHIPDSFGISMDDEGWVKLSELVDKIKAYKPHYNWLSEEVVKAIAQLDPKGRFELRGDLIRARYGHAKRLKLRLRFQEDNEASTLYHGTKVSNLNSILREGIKPMARHMVHLTSTQEEAINVAARRGREVVVFEVDADALRRMGIRVYRASKSIYVVRRVPPSAIKGYKLFRLE